MSAQDIDMSRSSGGHVSLANPTASRDSRHRAFRCNDTVGGYDHVPPQCQIGAADTASYFGHRAALRLEIDGRLFDPI